MERGDDDDAEFRGYITDDSVGEDEESVVSGSEEEAERDETPDDVEDAPPGRCERSGVIVPGAEVAELDDEDEKAVVSDGEDDDGYDTSEVDDGAPPERCERCGAIIPAEQVARFDDGDEDEVAVFSDGGDGDGHETSEDVVDDDDAPPERRGSIIRDEEVPEFVDDAPPERRWSIIRDEEVPEFVDDDQDEDEEFFLSDSEEERDESPEDDVVVDDDDAPPERCEWCGEILWDGVHFEDRYETYEDDDDDAPPERGGVILPDEEVTEWYYEGERDDEFLVEPPRYTSAGSTAGYMRVTAVESEHGGKHVMVLYRYTDFSMAPDGQDGVQALGDTMEYQARFIVPAAGTAATSLPWVGSLLVLLIYPALSSNLLQELWSSLISAVRIPAQATRLQVIVDVGILRQEDYTPARMEQVQATLERMMLNPWPNYYNFGMELLLPEPVPCAGDEAGDRRAELMRFAGQDCPICWDLLESRPIAAWPGCSHVFHGGCLELVLKAGETCPMCRHPLSPPPKDMDK